MKKKILFLSLLLLIYGIGGCSKVETVQREEKTIKFCYQDGTPALTVAKLLKDNPSLSPYMTIEYEMDKSPDLLVTKILKEEADIAIVPSNLVATAYNKGLPYKIAGTATWGSFYLTSTDYIGGYNDLRGKEIYSFGKGLTPDLVLRYVLSKNGIDPDKDVNINYLNAASELGPMFLSGKTNLALLAEPLLTTVMMKKNDARIILDLNEEWSLAAKVENGFPQASVIIKKELIEEDTEFVDEFLLAYQSSRLWAVENLEELSQYAEEQEISVAKETIEKGIIWNKIDTFYIEDCKGEYQAYYRAIMDFEPEFIGGKEPDEGIYIQR
ncbi:MAG: MqnA/MqnD/SBP family protein [Tissierellaceae bacterium]